MKRPTRGSTPADLAECAAAAGYSTVAEWVSEMWEVLEDFYELKHGGWRGSKTNYLEEFREIRLRRIVRGR